MRALTLQDLNPHNYDTDIEQHTNLCILLERLNTLQDACKIQFKVNSGLRSEADQMRINPKAPRSKHLIGAAADISDPNHLIWSWCQNNMAICEAVGVWFETVLCTPTWLHIQCVPPKSGSRVFIP